MIKHPFIIIFILLFSAPTYAQSVGSILNICAKDNSHVEMRKCVNDNASTSNAMLLELEYNFINRLSKISEEEERIKKDFNDGRNAFQIYREKQCNFYASMAMGGNSANDLRLSCIAMLNSERVAQLKWIYILMDKQ